MVTGHPPGAALETSAALSRRLASGDGSLTNDGRQEATNWYARPPGQACGGPGARRVSGVEPAPVKVRGHDQRQRHRGGAQLVDRQPARREHLEERAPREEAQVGPVEDAAVRVVESAEQEREPDPEMGDVGDGDDDAPAPAELRAERDQGRHRIRKVLEHVAAHDRVERPVEPGHRVGEVRHDDLVATRPRPVGLKRIALQRRDDPPALAQELGEEPVGGPHVEGPTAATGTEQRQDHAVARMSVLFELIGRAAQDLSPFRPGHSPRRIAPRPRPLCSLRATRKERARVELPGL